VFLAFVHDLEHWLWDDLPSALGASSPPWYLVIGLPAVGALVVVVARRFFPGDGGHSPLQGIGGGYVPVANGPGIALAAIGTLAFGAVLGPEAPLIALGAVTGIMVTSFVKLGEEEQAVVATAGSFSAISALFGGPIVGGMLMVEGGLEMGALLLPVLLPGFVAAAVGYVIFVGFGHWGGLATQSSLSRTFPTTAASTSSTWWWAWSWASPRRSRSCSCAGWRPPSAPRARSAWGCPGCCSPAGSRSASSRS
jgi:H+/Cl- antiporter ClcA